MKPPPIAIMDLNFGFAVSQTLYVAAKLDIANKLVERPKTAAEIAAEVGADAGRVERILNACMRSNFTFKTFFRTPNLNGRQNVFFVKK